MVKIIAGSKGVGKTQKLIELANAQISVTDGDLVFIDDDSRHRLDVRLPIRFVETGKKLLSNYREFVGFVLGILSQNADIKTVYIDSLYSIIEKLDTVDLVKLIKRLEGVSAGADVEFVLCVSGEAAELPPEAKALLI